MESAVPSRLIPLTSLVNCKYSGSVDGHSLKKSTVFRLNEDHGSHEREVSSGASGSSVLAEQGALPQAASLLRSALQACS